ncbi:MAG: hypothetical protein WDZ45_02840 [Flavobacteriaceae bacterium]
MKNKIDIGVFVKRIFNKNTNAIQPDEKVFERIQLSLDKQERKKRILFFWIAFSVILISTSSYLIWGNFSSKLQSENKTQKDESQVVYSATEGSSDELIGPLQYSDMKPSGEDEFSPYNSTFYHYYIIDTTQQNVINRMTNEERIKSNEVNYDIDKLFEQKTTYYYYRSSGDLRIETTDKKVIDSIMSSKNND